MQLQICIKITPTTMLSSRLTEAVFANTIHALYAVHPFLLPQVQQCTVTKETSVIQAGQMQCSNLDNSKLQPQSCFFLDEQSVTFACMLSCKGQQLL